jgi:hypothetical protein
MLFASGDGQSSDGKLEPTTGQTVVLSLVVAMLVGGR